MKKLNVGLIFKIACIVFVGFAAVLGNEIRLGINRYVKNTLQTDAESMIRNLEKFAKDYSELTLYDSCSLSSDQFKHIYDNALSGDSSLIKSLVTTKGKIIDVSRETEDDPFLCIDVKQFDEAKDWIDKLPGYFYINSLSDKSIEKLEEEFNNEETTSCAIEMSIVFPKDTDYSRNEFKNIKIAQIKIDGNVIISQKVSGQKKKVSGNVSFYSSQYKEVFFGDNKGSITYGQIVSRTLIDNKQTIIINYRDAIKGVQQQLHKPRYLSHLNTESAFLSTNYADYYLLDTYQYGGKNYSSVLIKLVDWTEYNQVCDDPKNNDLSDEKKLDLAVRGYLIVTKEYTKLYSNAAKQFVIDNSSTYFLAFVFIILICFILAYMIIKPIQNIESMAKHIARKEFDYPININRRDELGSLARSLDTMSKELEKTIDHLYQQIEKVQSLESLRKKFVSDFTHEIKTPLGIINGFSELIEIEQDESKRNEYITIIQNETQKINALVIAMLEYSKLESENITINKEDVDLLDIVNENIDSMGYAFQKKNIDLKTHLQSVVIQADRFKLEMIINNFISNAIKNTPPDQSIFITLNEHTFSIENEGKHIPENELEKIWLSFYQVDKSRNAKGTGLGLAICKAALELHHFDYGVENTERGVKFYFHF